MFNKKELKRLRNARYREKKRQEDPEWNKHLALLQRGYRKRKYERETRRDLRKRRKIGREKTP